MTSHDLLLKWSRNRDELAFRELVQRHAPMVFATSRRILGNETDAQDVTQDCFETLAVTRRPPRTHLGAWLHRVATNRCLDRLRATGRRAQRETNFAADRFQAAATGWNDIYDLVDAAILDLPEKFRAVVVAHFLEGRSQADIANELHLTRQAVHERLNRGIEDIRIHLKRRGVEISAATLTALLVQHASAATIPATLAVSLGKLALGASTVAGQSALSWLVDIGARQLLAGVAASIALVAGVLLVRSNSAPHASKTIEASPAPVEAIASVDQPTSQQSTPAAPGSRWPLEPSSMPPPVVVPGKLAEPGAGAKLAGASVSGMVIRADGNLFPHATVWLIPVPTDSTPSRGGGGSGKTDATGGFELKELAAGEYSVQVTPPGLEMTSTRYEVTRLVLEPNEQRRDFRIYYGKEGKLKISGIVVDTAGKPIKGATVETGGQYTIHRAALSDDQGHFVLEFLPPGGYEITAGITPGFPVEFAEAYSGAMAGDENLVITLERTITLEGRVVRADTRAPIQNYIVSFMNGHAQEFREHLLANEHAITDSQGRFRLRGAPPGGVTVSAIADGFSPAFIHANGRDGVTVTGLEIALSPGRTVRGTVVDTDGNPIAGAKIYSGEVTFPDMLEHATIAAETGSAGTFSIAEAPPLRSFLSAYRNGYAPVATRIGEGDLRIVMTRPATLRVIATEPGHTINGARVMIFFGQDAHTDYAAGMKFDESGVAVEAGLIPGLVRVRIHRRNDTDKIYVERDILLKAGETSELRVDFAPITASLGGVITWRGEPAHTTGVHLLVDTGLGHELYQVITTRDGAYIFPELPAGEAIMRVEVWEDTTSGNSIRSVFNNIQLAPGSVTTYDMTLLGAGSVSGKITGLDPSRMASVKVIEGLHTLQDLVDENILNPGDVFRLVAGWGSETDRDYFIDGLEAGDYTLFVESAPKGDWSRLEPFTSTHIRVNANQTTITDFQYR